MYAYGVRLSRRNREGRADAQDIDDDTSITQTRDEIGKQDGQSDGAACRSRLGGEEVNGRQTQVSYQLSHVGRLDPRVIRRIKGSRRLSSMTIVDCDEVAEGA